MKRKTKKNVRIATRFFLLVSTIVLLGIGTIVALEITYTQIRMGMLYSDIQSAEDARQYNAEMALSAENSSLAKYYQYEADMYDAEVKRLTQKRTDLVNSSNHVVAWAAKNQFELSTFGFGIGMLAIMCLLWYLSYNFMTPILRVEESIFYFLMNKVFLGLSFLLYMMHLGAYKVSKAYSRKKPAKKCRIVPIDKKRRIG